MENTIKNILAENARRKARRELAANYDPVYGRGSCGKRSLVRAPDNSCALVPVTMVADPEYRSATTSMDKWKKLRCHHDFEYWCATCITIKHKLKPMLVPFVLNAPQRRVTAMLEEDRLEGRPLRLIMLKARQWGGSTLVQMYMAWIQSVHRRNWHSLICAHVKDTANNIRSMYTTMLENYPPELWEGDAPPGFKAFERSQNTRLIAGRNCRVTLASAEKQDAVRGCDYAMAHMSETAFWPQTPRRSPLDFIRAVCGAIAFEPYTLVAMESTANGVGNFFHTEWMRCVQGKGDKRCVFVPWHEIEIYSRDIPRGTEEEVWKSLTTYELKLWDQGLTLEQIYWYHCKCREYATPELMHAEYPGTPEEAFINTGTGVFDTAKINALRAGCLQPVFRGEVNSSAIAVPDARGNLEIWEHPSPGQEYIAALDVGGRSAGADWSVIAVLTADAHHPRVVAQWRGHIDHDLLARRAIDLSRYYNEALLVVESNTFESTQENAENHLPVLATMASEYRNLYTRRAPDSLQETYSQRVGFHTNRRTKPLLIDCLIAAVRDATYTERSHLACNEFTTYAQLPNGSFAARPGNHDDVLMTRALALYVLRQDPRPALPLPLPPQLPLQW